MPRLSKGQFVTRVIFALCADIGHVLHLNVISHDNRKVFFSQQAPLLLFLQSAATHPPAADIFDKLRR